MRKIDSLGLNYNDILLLPQHATGDSRACYNISSYLFNTFKLRVPILSANMDTVTNALVANEMDKAGGAGILHRYKSPEDTIRDINYLKYKGAMAIPSIGVGEDQIKIAMQYKEHGASAINIDVAHGDTRAMVDLISNLKLIGLRLPIIAGNVCTPDACQRLIEAGADAVKVGIGNGKACGTQAATGHGHAQLSTVMECAPIVHKLGMRLIADGGIRDSGDIVKALAAGADTVMIGSLFAGSKEIGCSVYRGMASADAQREFKGYAKNIEGRTIPIQPQYKPIAEIMQELKEGIQSGFSYSGAYSIEELRQNAEYIILHRS